MSDPSYHSHARPEVKDLVLANGMPKRVLDVGCGTGNLGASLKAAGVEYVAGIEVDKEAVEEAKTKLDSVLWQNLNDEYFLQRIKLEEPDAVAGVHDTFDTIIFADCLEHLSDPYNLLRWYVKDWLTPGGQVIVSIPNIRHESVLLPLLLNGRFDYQDAGILDRTHLRFFTLNSALALLKGAGLKTDGNVRAVTSNPSETFGELVTALRLMGVARFNLEQEAMVVQYLLRGVKP